MPPNQQGQAAVTINTKILKYLVLTIVLCGTFGVLIYLANVVVDETIMTAEPPMVYTLTTEKMLIEPVMTLGTTEKVVVPTSTTGDTTTSTTVKSTTTSTVSLNQDITEASTQTTSISVFFRSINLDGYESTYITASVKDCEEVCIQTTNCDWFFIIRPKCYLGTYKGSSDTPTIKNPIQLIEKHVYFITDKLNQLTSSKPVVDFVAENKMIKPFDRYTIIGMNMDQCKAACFFDIDTCSYYYMDADVCYIGYYYAWAGYQNFLRSELSLGVSQLHMPKQLKVTNDFDFKRLTFPYEEDMLVSTFAKIPKDEHCNALAFQKQYDFYYFNRFKKECYLGYIGSKVNTDAQLVKLPNIFVNPIQPFKITDYYAAVNGISIQLENAYDYFWPIWSKEACAIACLQLPDCYAYQSDDLNHCKLGFVHSGNHVSPPNQTISYPFANEQLFFKLSLLQNDMDALFVSGNKVADIHDSFGNYQFYTNEAHNLVFCQFLCNLLPYEECQMIAYQGIECLLIRNLSFTIGPEVASKLTIVPDSNVYHRISANLSTIIDDPPKMEKIPNFTPNQCPPHKFYLVGNGLCDDESNNAECGWDNNECCHIVVQKGNCIECKCHQTGLTNMDIADDLNCQLIWGGLNYIEDGVCNQELNYPNCMNYDAGDCCDPRSVVDHSYARQYNYNNMCHFLGSIIPLNITNFGMMFYNGTLKHNSTDPYFDFSYEIHKPNITTEEFLGQKKRMSWGDDIFGYSFHVPIIRHDSNAHRWSAATFAWPKLLSTATYSQYFKFNTKQAREMMYSHLRFLKFRNLVSLKNKRGKGALTNFYSGRKKSWAFGELWI